MEKVTIHELTPTERLVMKQVANQTFPIRQEIKRLAQQANLQEVSAAADILEAIGLNAQVQGLARNKKGEIVSISYGLIEPDKEAGKEAVESPAEAVDKVKPGPIPATQKRARAKPKAKRRAKKRS